MSTKKFAHMVLNIYSTLPNTESGGQLINSEWRSQEADSIKQAFYIEDVVSNTT